MATRNYLAEHGVDSERIRLTQEGALEPDTLYTGDSNAFRAPVSRYSRWTNTLIKGATPSHSPAVWKMRTPGKLGDIPCRVDLILIRAYIPAALRPRRS